MDIIETLQTGDYEQLLVAVDKTSGLRAFVCIHDTTLGPSLGGVRIWPHATEADALADVLRLARAMTYKSAAAGLDFGGGKGLIWADPSTGVSNAAIRAFARHVDSLGGRYITTEDVGVTPERLVEMSKETRHVVGLPAHMGGSGNTSHITGFGVYRGMEAAVYEAFGVDCLKDVTVAVQGFGKVANSLVGHLLAAGARVTVTDVDREALERARLLNCRVLEDPDAIYDVECDVFAPCALGGVLNEKTIRRLRAKVVAGAANNQLLTPDDGRKLWHHGIVYVPDFIINAGGVINLAVEVDGYDENIARERVGHIYDTVTEVLSVSHKRGIPPHEAADRLAEERLERARLALKGQLNGQAHEDRERFLRVRTPDGALEHAAA
ncbi:MAG: leucine dehydrogenase [Chloroflexi bacterium]|nr:leucine dehydrogenase [Chloroflexota bacterium]